MKLTYSNQLDGFDPDERYRNPEHFDKPEAGVTSVLVIGDWPKVVDAYESVGVDVSVKEGARVQVVGTDNQAELERLIAGLRAENNAIVFLVDGLKSGEVVRPDSGELAICLFDAFESAHTALGELTKARDDLASTVGELRGEIEALKKAAVAQTADEAGAVAALKAKLDEAKVPYRANASKESLEKLVADLSKE